MKTKIGECNLVFISFYFLSDQNNSAFSENSVTEIIYAFGHIHISSALLCCTIDVSIPTFIEFACVEKQLTPSIIYSEIIQL